MQEEARIAAFVSCNNYTGLPGAASLRNVFASPSDDDDRAPFARSIS